MKSILLVIMLVLALPGQEAKDDHFAACHPVAMLRFYRVYVGARWTRWYLIDTPTPEDKTEINAQLAFYRANDIKLEFAAVEGKLP